MDDTKVTRSRKRDDYLIDGGGKRLPAGVVNSKAPRHRGGRLPPVEENAVALIGATAIQSTDAEATSSADLRQLVCSLFVDSIIATVPKRKRRASQKELVELLQRLKIVSADYFTDKFFSARRPLSALISKFVIQACQQEPTIDFAPNSDSPLSVNGFSLVNSRYLSDFEEISRIGVGGFGKVFKVRSLVDNQLYAIKQIRFDNSSSESFSKVLSECRYHASLQNEHVVRYHNAWVEFEPPVRSKRADPQPKPKRLPITRNCSLQSTVAWDNSSHNVGRVVECSTSVSPVTVSPQKPSGGGGKFWQSRRAYTAPNSMSQSASSDSGEDAIPSQRRSPHSDVSTSSFSVKFELNDQDQYEENGEGSVRFDAKNAGAMVLWSEAASDLWTSQVSGQPAPIRKSRSSPTFGDSAADVANCVDLDFGVPVLYIQMELCSSTLEKYLLERKTLNMEFNEATVFGLLSAIDFLHNNQLIHRDVKPSNVLLKRRNGRWCALLGDFGLTREVSQLARPNPASSEFSIPTTSAGRGEICRVNMPADSSKLTGGIGTALYAAPEQIVSQDYGPSVDVYSAGIVFYELFQIFKTSMERIMSLTKLRENARPPEKFRLIWPEICAFIERMIPIEPDSRWTAAQVLACLCVSKNQLSANVACDGGQPLLMAQNCSQEDVSTAFSGSYLTGHTGSAIVRCESGPSDSAEQIGSPLVTTPTNLSLVDPAEELQQLRRRNAELESIVESLQRELAVYKKEHVELRTNEK